MRERNFGAGFSFASALLVGWVVGQTAGCGAPDADAESRTTDNLEALAACNMDDGTVEPTAQIGGCDGTSDQKATICHVPRGNPANAHTLCIGAAAVTAHLGHHGDYMGACQTETACPKPKSRPDGGAGTHTGYTGTGTGTATTGAGGSGKCARGGTGGTTGGSSTGGRTGTGTGGTGASSTGGAGGTGGTGGAGEIVIL